MSQTASRRARQALDAAVYALAVAAVVFLVGVTVGLAVGSTLVTAKFVMFVVGLLLFGYGTFKLRPDPPWGTESDADGRVRVVENDRSGTVVGSREETRFQAAVQRIPPVSWYSLPPDDRLSSSVKMFLASIAVLGWSYAMETVFGVAA